jgi:hypothetical protein
MTKQILYFHEALNQIDKKNKNAFKPERSYYPNIEDHTDKLGNCILPKI